MTTTTTVAKKCFVCGSEHEYDVLTSTSSFGYADLDGRPAAPARTGDLERVLRCPTCGYCAIAIDQGPDVAAAVVHSQPYQAQLEDVMFPSRATAWLCAAMIADAAGQPAQAGWGAVRAAWVCDDRASDGATSSVAVACRTAAIKYFQAAQAVGKLFYSATPGDGGDQLVLADLYRRTRDFGRAISLAKAGLALQPDNTMVKLLAFEQAMAENGDAGVHSAREAIEAGPQEAETKAHIAANLGIYATVALGLLAAYAIRRRRAAQMRAAKTAEESAKNGGR